MLFSYIWILFVKIFKNTKNMLNKKWFSILEVLISTLILSISVFSIYKLIGENRKSLEKSNSEFSVNNLFSVLENCIENKKNLTGSLYLDLWTDLKKCDFVTSEKINNIDWVDYIISIKKKAKSTNKFVFWETKIFSEYTNTKTWTYLQKK